MEAMDFGVIGKYNSINEIKERDKNPFLEQLVISERIILKRFKRGEAVVTDKISKIEDIKSLTKQNKELVKVDLNIGRLVRKQTSPFVLVYTDRVMNYRELSGTTLRVLFYIMYEKLSLGNDYVVMDSKELVDKLDISRNSAYTALLELVNNKLIDKRNDYNWWINPNYFYCGNRLSINTK